MEAVRGADPRLNAIAAVMEQWRHAIGAQSVTVADVIERAIGRVRGSTEYAHPDFREALLTIAGNAGAINSQKLGRWLSGVSGRIVSGSRFQPDGQRHKVAVWRLV